MLAANEPCNGSGRPVTVEAQWNGLSVCRGIALRFLKAVPRLERLSRLLIQVLASHLMDPALAREGLRRFKTVVSSR
jgi:hypothetical protein